MTISRCIASRPSARFIGDPIDVVTGAVVGIDREFQLPGPFQLLWRRYYDSRSWLEDAGCGLGFRFEYDRRLRFDLDGIRYVAPDRTEARFPSLQSDGERFVGEGFVVSRLRELRYEVKGADGVAMLFEFSDPAQAARLDRLSSAEHAVSFGYDHRGRLTTLADSQGRVLQVKHDSLGRMSRVTLTDPIHNLVDKVSAEYEYDGAGRLVRTTDPYGHHLAYAYDKYGRLSRFTDRNGYSFHYSYDVHGRCIHTRGDDGVEELALQYDRDARVTLVKRGNGGTWQYFYDDNDALVSVIDPHGGVTAYEYDRAGRLLSETRPDKTALTYHYDHTGANNVISLPTGAGVTPGAELNALVALRRRYRVHRVPTVAHSPHTDQHRAPATWEQGDTVVPALHGLPLKSTRLDFLSVEEAQSVIRADRPGSGLSHPTRDPYGLLIREQRDDGRSRQYHYDPNGNRARVTDFDGSLRRHEYASWNALVATTDALGNTTKLAYDVDENLTQLVDAGGTHSAYAYDQLKAVVDVRRNGRLRERFTNDAMGRPTARISAEGRVELRLVYNDQGLVAERILASGDKQSFEYGALGRLVRCSSKSGAVELEPEASGARACDLRNGRGVRHQRGWTRLATSTLFDRYVFRFYLFDDESTQMVVAPGDVVHRIRRCGFGIVRRELHHGAIETTQYDPRGRVVARLRVSPTGERHDTIYSYSGEGDLLQIADSARGLTRYEYDAAHRLLRVHAPNGTTSDDYLYDEAGNLLHMPGLNYFAITPEEQALHIDASVLRPSTHGVWLQGANQLYRAQGDHFTYGARDHVIERRSAHRAVVYAYDELDRLTSVQGSDGVDVTFEYDALGRRTRKLVGQQTTEFYWNGDRLAAELLPDGGLRLYVYADIDSSLAPLGFVHYASIDSDPSDGRHYYYSCNHLGAPERVFDQDGRIVWQAHIEPFGRATIEVGADFHQPLRFPGHYYDTETGLHYNRYRYYEPALGRYLQSDPVDIEGGHNLYAYAQDSNPLRDVDLVGLACQIAEDLLEEGLSTGIIKADGSPGKPLESMSPAEKQLFCAARAAQLANRMGDGSIQESATTVNVAIVKKADGTREIRVTASTDNGNPAPNVRAGMHPDGTPNGAPETSKRNFPIIRNSHKGKEHPEAAAAREEKGNRDGKVMKENRDGTVEPAQKKNRDNEDGSTDHHAEQRTQGNLAPGEEIEAMAPSKKCCEGCQTALAKGGNADKVPKDLGGQGAQILDP